MDTYIKSHRSSSSANAPEAIFFSIIHRSCIIRWIQSSRGDCRRTKKRRLRVNRKSALVFKEPECKRSSGWRRNIMQGGYLCLICNCTCVGVLYVQMCFVSYVYVLHVSILYYVLYYYVVYACVCILYVRASYALEIQVCPNKK